MKTLFVPTTLLILLAFDASARAAENAEDGSIASAPHNLVLFVADDLGWRDLGCQGSDYYRTPHIDRLAAEGVRFTQAYAATAICTPTRAAILTGTHPARLLMTQWLPDGRWDPARHRMRPGRFLRQLPLEETTLAEVLREEGYATWHAGKWHLGGAPFSLPEHHGFDVNLGGDDHGAPGSYFFPFEGTWKIPTTGLQVHKRVAIDGKEGDYLTDRLADEVIRLIEERDPANPFFLYLPFYNVHTPLQGKPELVKKYEAIPEAERQGKPAYAAMVESVDRNVGRIRDAIEQLGLADDTTLVFTSDNGGFAKATDNAPLRANKGSHYEGGIRVPLLFAGAGVERRGETCDLPALSQDLYPTLLALAGLPPRPHQHRDGIDLSGLLRKGGDPPGERALFWHYPHYNQHPESAPVSAIRKGKWKLIQFLETGAIELYDLESDPGESENRYREEGETAASLLAELEAWREEVQAEEMKPNPHYRP